MSEGNKRQVRKRKKAQCHSDLRSNEAKHRASEQWVYSDYRNEALGVCRVHEQKMCGNVEGTGTLVLIGGAWPT